MLDLCIYYTIFNQVNYIYLFKHQFFMVKALRTSCSSTQSVQHTTVFCGLPVSSSAPESLP